MDTVKRAGNVLADMIRVTADEVRGAHDAQMVIVKNKAYIVYEANDIRAGEGPWPFIYSAMSVVDIDTMQVLTVEKIAEPGQTFENVQLKAGRCFVPRILIRDEYTLRCFFCSIDDQQRESESWYRDYDLNTGRFSDSVFPVYMETEDGRVLLSPTPFHAAARKQGFMKPLTQDGPYLFDADKEIDGKHYVSVSLYSGQLCSLAVFNEDLDTLRILSYMFEPQQDALSEAAVEKMPDGRWVAVLRNDSGDHNYRFTVSEDGIHWSPAEERPIVRNGSNSKPLLHCFDGVYCLGWQEKPARSRFNIDISPDLVHWKRMFSFDDADFSFQYPAMYVWRNTVYICGTHCFPGNEGDRRDSIYFGRLCSLDEMRE